MRVLSVVPFTASLALTVYCGAQVPVPSPTAGAVKKQGPAPANLCPLTIYIDAQGRLFDSRFAGRYRVSEQTLRNDIGGGCKERGQTSSVRVEASPQTKFGRLKEVMDLVKGVRPDVPVTLVTPASRQ